MAYGYKNKAKGGYMAFVVYDGVVLAQFNEKVKRYGERSRILRELVRMYAEGEVDVKLKPKGRAI